MGLGLLSFVLGGAGCARPSKPPLATPIQVIEQSLRAPKAGDSVTLEESGLERMVTIESFVLGKTSAVAWRLTDPKKDHKEVKSGSWKDVTLNTAHAFYLPAIMESPTRPVNESSILWLPREEYRELVNTLGTTIDIRVLQGTTWEDVLKAKSFASAKRGFDALKRLAREQDDARKDLVFARKEANTVDYTLLVNGTQKTVKAFRLRNWYGTYDILENENMPLVLAFTLDPQVDKTRLDVSKGDGAALAQFMNYRVKELKMQE